MDALTVLRAGMIRWQRDSKSRLDFPDTPCWEKYLLAREITSDTVMNEFMWYGKYADKREDQPKSGILVGDWNRIPQRYQSYLERKGFELDWQDSTSGCDGCGHLISSEPDCYFWRPDYWVGEGDITCNGCTDWGEVLESKRARYEGVNTWQCEPKDYGWYLLEECGEIAEGVTNAKRKGYEQAVVLSGRSDVMREVWVKGATVDVPLSEARKPWDTVEIQVGAPI